ncbi:UDP-N-acetylglucosamine-N-acetylmuramylpentapeptide N-acetylglucosamine transferase [Desulfatibacillum alkenivorans DSM 16219]|jgi:UDP-N-acetylglucosamine--N-acetylmuramyl-(pentapeptide) pyrophosphoryl-undecaprenol N-acetylglucosamine transferase|uniref:UDP-N-acetylglucosamine--N-acetylmuramyl-(pentapeptide) pyrophosphoryl-undecaprenol N-acetylglucosamine transferase n=1 Tax=Desulfatibacillum alkenivorans DSM 16219 TaxID=1121393 RepID=A0A1M6E153_9BACT|nr:undecaprenyldiphospho-muramoylpentapeptide beta-N-acetylglucosaminyltransferase [Desulfatibacillum alkenivorans]SHI79181.1 UDP-N-acetylglucosamine-N-acetylmuramylpentapeptide N-acetylglucosamine transferase [Desulfatibacillum alkenivorans DSM 16219]
MKNETALKMIIAGGGTGGHLYPGIAVAEAVKSLVPDVDILFVGSRKPFEKQAVEKAGYTHKAISVEGLKGRGLLLKIRSLFKLAVSMITALALIIRFRPAVILGVGGYASAPCMLAGLLLFKKTGIQEQNLMPGMVNRWLGKVAGRAYVSFEKSTEYFKPGKAKVFGNPIRGSLLEEAAQADPEAAEKPFTVLVLGGSQGAHAINRAVIESLEELQAPEEIGFIHQTGQQDLETTQKAYENWKGPSDVRAFFHDMGAQYKKADLVVCRAGASTVAEVTALGKACIFIPFPFAADNHQEYNARALEDLRAAEVILEDVLTGTLLAERIAFYKDHKARLREMETAAKSLGKPRAAADIAEDVLAWLNIQPQTAMNAGESHVP